MTCAEAIRGILEAIDAGEGDASPGAAVEAHLAGCAPCAREAARYRADRGGILSLRPYGASTVGASPAAVAVRVTALAARARAVRRLSVAAAAVAAIGIGWWIRPWGGPDAERVPTDAGGIEVAAGPREVPGGGVARREPERFVLPHRVVLVPVPAHPERGRTVRDDGRSGGAPEAYVVLAAGGVGPY